MNNMNNMQCCIQDFKAGDEIKRLSDNREAWVIRTKPLGVCNAIVLKWKDNNALEAFYGQYRCNVFEKINQ